MPSKESKWPESALIIRHAESAYNELKIIKEKDPLYRDFREAFEDNPYSHKTKVLAIGVSEKLTLEKGDNATPLTERGRRQAFKTGEVLRQLSKKEDSSIHIPDAIFVSPHLRTRQTLQEIIRGWPEISEIKTIEDINLREQEHGLALIYNDWRVFHALHHEQMRLYSLEGPYWYRYPQGESVPDLQTRIKGWFDTIIRDYREKKLLVITHHLTILSIITMLERSGALEFIRMDQEEKPVNCGVTLFETNKESFKFERLLYNRKYW